jgi:hypothetical protein
MKKPAMSTREHTLSLIDLEIKRLVNARDILNGGKVETNHKRVMSAEARHRISLAQRRRWRLRKAG